MKPLHLIPLSLVAIGVLSACTTAPKPIESLEMARTLVPEVETSARAGVAAKNISDARKSLDTANRLEKSGGTRADIDYEAQNAVTSAQIANERILTAQAQEEAAKGAAQQQEVLLQARQREADRSAQTASDARDAADASRQRSASLEDELAALKAKRTERGLVLTLGDVLFDTGQAQLRMGAYGTLDRLATALKDNPERSVVIEGHTDNVGSGENNQGLSERRAQAVLHALQQRGVATTQTSALGRGENVPVASNDDMGGRQQNRRVELIFAAE